MKIFKKKVSKKRYKKGVSERTNLQDLLEKKSNEFEELCAERNVLRDNMIQERRIYQEAIDINIRENEICQIKLEVQKEKLEKITMECSVLKALLSRCVSRETPYTSSNDTTTGVNAETITLTPPEEE